MTHSVMQQLEISLSHTKVSVCIPTILWIQPFANVRGKAAWDGLSD